MNVKAPTPTQPTTAAPAGLRCVCGIDASRADEATVGEACALAGQRGHVALVCVVHSSGVGHNAQATITAARATTALERAMKQTRAAGVRSSAYLLHNPHASDTLLRAATDSDVLVVGSHGGGRAGGIALGRVTTNALHRATVPVLVARPSPPDADGSILVASDGSPGTDAACGLASSIAARTGSPVILFTAGDDTGESGRRALARQAVELAEATGREATVISGRGKPAEAIANAAAASGCSLLVVGSGGRTGLRALGSVSESVAHRAPCSVLVARPPSKA